MTATTLLEQLRHACSVALGDLIALGMPIGASTGKLLKEALTAVESAVETGTPPSTGAPTKDPEPPKISYPPIEAGTLLYAVGPSWFGPGSNLQVYSAIVRTVSPPGSYSANCPPALIASAPIRIWLYEDRPFLGFPKWVYNDHEIGVTLHRSEIDALRSFVKQARRRRTEAAHTYTRANEEVEWALAAIAAYPEHVS
jgi:hypothetical protein